MASEQQKDVDNNSQQQDENFQNHLKKMPAAFRSISASNSSKNVTNNATKKNLAPRSASYNVGLHISKSTPDLAADSHTTKSSSPDRLEVVDSADSGNNNELESPTLPGSNRISNPQSSTTTTGTKVGEDDGAESETITPTVTETTNNNDQQQVEEAMQDDRTSALKIRKSMELNRPKLNNNNTVVNTDSRDRYGFKKQTAFVTQEEYDKWWCQYVTHIQRRKRKWIKLMKDSGLYTENNDEQQPPVRFPPKSEKLKRYIRKGIPAEWRGNAWFWYAKGPEKLASHPGLYDKLCKQTASLKNNDTALIERDLQRTFPDNVYFRTTDTSSSEETTMIRSLRRVLTSFSVYSPKIGYCQSLNFLAGMLLLFMDEEKAFWMLVIITQRYLPGVHEVNLEGVNVDQGVLMLCIRDCLPELWDKLGVNFEGQHYDNILTKLPPITLCTASWFMSGFIGVLPTETVLRVWDSFFFEESKIFFRIALTLLKLSENQIANLSDQMEVFQAIQNLPKKLVDPNILMEPCFNRRSGFSQLSQPEILRLRDFVSDRRRHQLTSETNPHDPDNENDPIDGYTDLEAFKKLKPVNKRKVGLQLSKRMKSLRIKNQASTPTLS